MLNSSFYGSASRVGDGSTGVWNLLGSAHCTPFHCLSEGSQLRPPASPTRSREHMKNPSATANISSNEVGTILRSILFLDPSNHCQASRTLILLLSTHFLAPFMTGSSHPGTRALLPQLLDFHC